MYYNGGDISWESKHSLVQAHLLDYYVPSGFSQGNSPEILREDLRFVVFIAIAHQFSQISIDFQAPHIDFLENYDELLNDFELDEHG